MPFHPLVGSALVVGLFDVGQVAFRRGTERLGHLRHEAPKVGPSASEVSQSAFPAGRNTLCHVPNVWGDDEAVPSKVETLRPI